MKISVVITTFNRPDYLALSLASVIAQKLAAYEIIVIDDNSTTDYASVLEKFSGYDVRYIKLSKSSGANVARNNGVNAASGDVVAFLDDDDIWLENYLEHHHDAYIKGADAVVSGYKHLDNESQIRVNSDKRVTRESLVKGNKYCGMSGFSCRREILNENLFDISLNNGQDWDMFVRLFLQGFHLANISLPIFLYRFQSIDGIGAKLRKMKPSEIERRLGSARKHREFLGDYWFNQRVAEQILGSLRYKKGKLSWIKKSIEIIGLRATSLFFIRKIKMKLSVGHF